MRTVTEWIGESPDTKIPNRVRVRVFEAKGGKCHRCGRRITVSDSWTLEHLIALANGGENRERNLDLTCRWCLPEKNAEDVAIKSHGYEVRKRHIGIKKPRSRLSHPTLKRKIGTGKVVNRFTGEEE